MERRQYIEKAKRIVIKIGSQLLEKDNDIDIEFISDLARQISLLKDKEIIIVSSGAVLAGVKKIKTSIKTKKHYRKTSSSKCWTGIFDANL